MRFVVVVRQPHTRNPHRNRRNSGRLRHLGCHGNRFPMSLQIDRMARRVPVPQLRPEQRAFFDGRRSADAFRHLRFGQERLYAICQRLSAEQRQRGADQHLELEFGLDVERRRRKPQDALPYTEVWAYDPLHIAALSVKRFNNAGLKSTPSFITDKFTHFFKVKADDADTDLVITVRTNSETSGPKTCSGRKHSPRMPTDASDFRYIPNHNHHLLTNKHRSYESIKTTGSISSSGIGRGNNSPFGPEQGRCREKSSTPINSRSWV